jgi:hypothetical protein
MFLPQQEPYASYRIPQPEPSNSTWSAACLAQHMRSAFEPASRSSPIKHVVVLKS